MAEIKNTKNSMVQFVYPEHANNLGTLHGGRLMDWVMLTGTITASRFSKSTTLLGATDSIDFINSIKIGDVVMLDSWIEYVGSSSLEVVVRVYSENIESGEKKFITLSNLAFVAIEDSGKPKKIGKKITSKTGKEKMLIQKAEERKRRRLPEIQKRRDKILNALDETETTRYSIQLISAELRPELCRYQLYVSRKTS